MVLEFGETGSVGNSHFLLGVLGDLTNVCRIWDTESEICLRSE
jgi:hypothetical protein